MGDKAAITPSVIKWARETARMDVETAAKKAGVPGKKLLEWESGADLPTVRQAKLLAEAFRRPFALFMLPKPPRDFMPLQDFRRRSAVPLGTASIFIIRELREKQAWVRDWMEEQGEEPLSFVGRFSLKDSPAIVAADILQELDIHPLLYEKPMKEWLTKAENKGIYISRGSNLHHHLLLNSDEFQGFALADPLVPFIFINTEDWGSAQLFTLVHELAHIWIAQSGVSGEVGPEWMAEAEVDPTEMFCNRVAASALMPEQLVGGLDPTVFDTAASVLTAARKLGVSAFALLIRAKELGLIIPTKYNRLRMDAEQAFRAYEAKEEARNAARKAAAKEHQTGPSTHQLQANRNGLRFSRLVLDAYHGGDVLPTEASDLLGTKVSSFQKLEKYVYP
jgi:Zn-dependent peptidase ImmA (M78 family)/DNA-binding XRE family transcriptional regulator